MRNVIYVLLSAICLSSHAATNNAALNFFVVSDREVAGGRFIDSAKFEKLGYISGKPDLVITNLLELYHTKSVDHAIMVDAKGGNTVAPLPSSPALGVRLHAADGDTIEHLTTAALGKRLVVMLGDRILVAPIVAAPIQIPVFEISFESEAELVKVEGALKALVGKRGGEQAGATDGSQPTHSETNRTSSAAGSSR
jgi:hypothetical protein